MVKNINNSVRYESNLVKYRKMLGYTRKQMAKRFREFGIEIKDVTYDKWEYGYRCPSLHTCNKIRMFLQAEGLEVNDLLDIFPKHI